MATREEGTVVNEEDGDLAERGSPQGADAAPTEAGVEPGAVVFDGPAAQFDIDLRIHGLSAIKKTAYRLAKRFATILGSPRGEVLPVRLELAAGAPEATVREAVRLFHRELIDQDLREEVARETAPMRALILAHAFSRTGVSGKS